MLALLRGAGGLIEQTYLYYDHASAIDWSQIAAQQEYAEAHRIMPLDRAAEQLFRSVGDRGLDVIALGPGDGRLETRLVAHLAQRLQHPAIRFYLLDISQPLLAEAYRHAADSLSLHAGITPVAIQGNFHHLPRYTQLLYVPQLCPRRQIVIMIGGTFGNIDDERHFIRDSMCGFAPGSLALIDYPGCFAPTDQPQEIWRRDPWLNGGGKGSVAWRERVMAFWSGPVRRYVPGVKGIEFRMELSTSSSTIPRSPTPFDPFKYCGTQTKLQKICLFQLVCDGRNLGPSTPEIRAISCHDAEVLRQDRDDLVVRPPMAPEVLR